MDNSLIYSVGGKAPAFRYMPEGVMLEADGGNFLLAYKLANPTLVEIEQTLANMPLEFRFMVSGNAVWLLSRFGELPWSDAPYTPHLSPNGAAELLCPSKGDGTGIPLLFLMIDAETNIIKGLRLIGLGNQFSIDLYNEIAKLRDQPFDKASYHKNVQAIQKSYSSEALAAMCTHSYIIRPDAKEEP